MPTFTSATLGRYTGKWLIGTGIFELALAAVFAVVGLAVPLLGFGFLLTAAILGATGAGSSGSACARVEGRPKRTGS